MNEQHHIGLAPAISALAEAGFPNLAEITGDLPIYGSYRITFNYQGTVAQLHVWQADDGWMMVGYANYERPRLR